MTKIKPASAFESDDGDKGQVSALARGLLLLDCFDSSERFLGIQDFVERSNLPKATVSRLAHTLTASGYLEYSDSLSKFYLGAHLMSLGFSVLGSLQVRQVARPLMRELAESCSASVALGTRDRDTMLYVENAAGAANQNFRLSIGSRVPLATTAMGRAHYCGLTEAERGLLLSGLAERSPSEFKQIKESLQAGLKSFKSLGFCVSVGDWQSDVNAVAVPYRSADGTSVLSFNCCGPSFLITPQDIAEKWGPRLLNMVQNIKAATSAA
ncbi:MAG TPA: IclR family transcriptional regulator [Herbaspirillum sp.]|jgi:DNA-binding IclR family transcriptional regulator